MTTELVQKTLCCRIGEIAEKIARCSNHRTKHCNMDVFSYFRLKNQIDHWEFQRTLDDPVVSDAEITREVKHWISLYLNGLMKYRTERFNYAIYRAHERGLIG